MADLKKAYNEPQQYAETLFNSVELVVKKALSQVAFDQTISATVIEQDKEDKTKYQVTNGSLNFEAYSLDTNKNYTKGATVYVTVPCGDYANKKIIIGTASNKEISKIEYQDPMDQIIVGKNVAVQKEIKIVTNQSVDKPASYRIDSFSFPSNCKLDYNRFALSYAINSENLIDTTEYKGGFQILVKFLDDDENEIFAVSTTEKDIVGNIFALTEDTVYSMLFEIPENTDISLIKKVDILFYQTEEFELSNKAIYLKQLSFAFGYDVKTFEPQVKLILNNGQGDKYNLLNLEPGQEEDFTRDFSIEWLYQHDNIQYLFHLGNKPENLDYKIFLLRSNKNVNYGGTDEFPSQYSELYNWEIIETTTDFKFENIKLRNTKSTDILKLIIKQGDNYLVSNHLTFVSEDLRPDDVVVSGTFGLKFANEKDNGVYNSYNIDGSLMISTDRGPHILQIADLSGKSRFIEKVEYTIPDENTMLEKNDKVENSNVFPFPFSFNIKNRYYSQATNNIIVATIYLKDGTTEILEKTIQVGYATTNGTDCIFDLALEGNRVVIGEEKKRILVKFADISGNTLMSDTEPEIQWTLLNPIDGLELSTENNHEPTISYSNSTIPTNNYSVVKAEIKNYTMQNGFKTSLTSYLAIPIATSEYSAISGATKVIYGSTGYDASYDNTKYVLYNNENQAVEDGVVRWDISYTPDRTYTWGVPRLQRFNNSSTNKPYSVLQPPSYLPKELPKVSVYATITQQVGEELTDVVVWSQPILFMQNVWDKGLINEWDGSFAINEDSGTILSNLLVAGTKNTDNTFSGVILGEMSKAGNSTGGTGLYGYREGTLAFSFDENGDAFIGKNGNYLQFKDSNFSLKATDVDLQAKRFLINVSNPDETKQLQINSDSTVFRIGTYDSNNLTNGIEYKNDGLIIKSTNFNLDSNGNVSVTGEIKATKLTLDSEATITDDNNIFVITGKEYGDGENTAFSVSKTGVLSATGANITGNITATEGNIGGWTIKNASGYNGGIFTSIQQSSDTTYKIGMKLPGKDGSNNIKMTDAAFYVTRWDKKKDGTIKQHNIFYVDYEGKLRAANGNFIADANGNVSVTGAITATSLDLATNNVKIPYTDISDSPDLNNYLAKKANILSTNASGALIANDAVINGTIYATSGYIGGDDSGWAISSNLLHGTNNPNWDGETNVNKNTFNIYLKVPTHYGHNGDGNIGNNGISASASDVLIIGATKNNTNTTDYPFCLWSDGTLKATKAIIEGNITATSLKLSNSCKVGNDLTLSSTGAITATSANITGAITATSFSARSSNSNNVVEASLTSTSFRLNATKNSNAAFEMEKGTNSYQFIMGQGSGDSGVDKNRFFIKKAAEYTDIFYQNDSGTSGAVGGEIMFTLDEHNQVLQTITDDKGNSKDVHINNNTQGVFIRSRVPKSSSNAGYISIGREAQDGDGYVKIMAGNALYIQLGPTSYRITVDGGYLKATSGNVTEFKFDD